MLKDRIRSLRQENEKINKELTRMVALKKEEDTHDCKHKTMFIRKCEEIERIEDKFEEISQKFSLIMENINQSKASYLQDTTRLRELLVCILRCYKENNFEVLEYLFENLNGNFGSNDEIFEINALDKKRNINTPPRQERNKIKLSDKGLNHKGHEVNVRTF